MTIITQGQSLVDVAVQAQGTVASLFDLADANGIAITDLLTPGQVLAVPASAGADIAVAGYFAGNAYRVNTGDVAATAPVPQAGDYTNDYTNDYLTSSI